MDEKFNLDSIDKTFTSFKVGAKVNAEVVAFLKSGVLLNIGGKKDGIIKYSDEEDLALKDIDVGDKFEAIIIATKDETGSVVLSKTKADALKKGNQIVSNLNIGDTTNFIITSFNKSGLISKLGSFEVFIPYSQISNRKIDNNLQNYVNKQVSAVVLEIDLSNNKIVASIKAFEENELHTKETAFWQAIFENLQED